MESSDKGLVTVKTRQGVQQINPDEIIFCILKGRKVNISLISNEVIETMHNLKEIEEKLSHYKFIRCHNRCLVNFDKRLIFDSKNRRLELLNKQEIFVSKNKKALIHRLLK